MSLQSAFILNSNEIFGSIANMIISQEVFADNLGSHQTLVDKARVDGSLYGDKKLYYATDVLKTVAWGADNEATNLLSLDRPEDPKVQAITLDVFRQIRCTIDNYLSKRAWSSEGAFSSFNSVLLGWMRETKKVYDGTTYNVFIGTTEAAGAGQSRTVTVASNETPEGEAKKIAQEIADLLVEMGDYSRDFNDYGYLRSYADSDIKVIWNAKVMNRIKKVDLPAIFHKEGLMDKFGSDTRPARYFGEVCTSSDKGSGKIINASFQYDPTKGKLRFTHEIEVELASEVRHFFAGDEVPTKKLDGTTSLTVTIGGDLDAKDLVYSDVYKEDESIIAKVCVKLPPYMSAFEVATSFFNPRSLTENHYLTFGHNTLQYLKNYPFITIKEVVSADTIPAQHVIVDELPETSAQ